jgi:RNA polymerase sigma-70 factor (ECF subfamily)
VTDVAILAAPTACSDDLFASLVERQSKFVFRIAWAVLRNAHDAEDVAQETFLKLYRTGSWRRIEDERAFLARTAWRLAAGRVRRRRTADIVGERQDLSADPERSAIALDLSSSVHRLIDALPEELRVPLALSAIDEMTSREIGAAMGIPEGTVRTRIMRAREILRMKLGGV